VPRHGLPPKLIDRLQEMPAGLEQEIQAYLQWCQRAVQPGRSHSVRKKPATTCQTASQHSLLLGGEADLIWP
jgi:hypothetical protein